ACHYKFQVNAFTCRFTPRLWSNSIVRYLAIQIGDDIIYVNDTNVGGSGINLVEPSDFSFPSSGITIQSPDRCFRLAVNQKPLDGGARWYHNVKLRVISDAVEQDGICGSTDLLGQLVDASGGGNADTIFTDEQLDEMCNACREPGAPPPLGCPGGPTNSPGCDFLRESTNLNSFECTPDLLPQTADGPDPSNLTLYNELTNDGDYCVAYVKVKGPGSSPNCDVYCKDIGSTCVGVWDQLSDTTCNLDPVNVTELRRASCTNRAKLMDMICICDKPPADNPLPGPGPERVCGDDQSLVDAKELCRICLPNAELLDNPVSEEDARFRSCIIDVCSLPASASEDDKKAMVENMCENDPELPPDGDQVCSAGGFCDAICGGSLLFPSLDVSACRSACEPIFELKVSPGLRGFCDYKDTCTGADCSDPSYYCPLLCQSLDCAQTQDGCTACEQTCSDRFDDVDDIIEEYCDDCYTPPEPPTDVCERSGFCAEYCKSADALKLDPAQCDVVCNSEDGFSKIIGAVETKVCGQFINNRALQICKSRDGFCWIPGKRSKCFNSCAASLVDPNGLGGLFDRYCETCP
ncbi:unnamed protein product, partial [Symbiodinium pilosum]